MSAPEFDLMAAVEAARNAFWKSSPGAVIRNGSDPMQAAIEAALPHLLSEKDAEVKHLQELAIDQHGEPYRDRFRNQMDAAAELLAEVNRIRDAVAAVEALCDEWDAYDAEGAAGDGPPALARVEEILALLAEATK